MKIKPKLIVILGPTASGKSDLAVGLAKKFNGEIISADSRQVYKGLNIGTGKITKKEMDGIPHHLIDVVQPKKVFTIAQFKELSETIINEIHTRGKIPIICGGTGFYIQSIVDNIELPEVPPNKKLRKELAKKTTQELFLQLAKIDIRRAANIDANNRVRLIRALEIVFHLGSVPNINKKPIYKTLQIGIVTDDTTLKKNIHVRLLLRIKKGMIREVKKLHEQGLSWKRMNELGLEYRYIALYLEKKITKEEMITKLEQEIWHYAKRQKTWFKKNKKIQWFLLKDQKIMEQKITSFLKK